MLNSSFWSGRNVLITGHTGFKGSWLTRILQKLNANCFGFSDGYLPDSSLFSEIEGSLQIKSMFGDIENLDAVNSAMSESNAEIVFHLAAQSEVLESYRNPLKTVSTNIIGSMNVLEAFRFSESSKVLIVVTSDKCYAPNYQQMSLSEQDPLGHSDIYGTSKACVELLSQAFQNCFLQKLDDKLVSTVRAGNVIGGGDWAKDRLVPDLIRNHFKGFPISIRNPDAVRPWQHVLEPLFGYLHLATKMHDEPNLQGAWNFGPDVDSHLSVGDLVEFVNRKLGNGRQCQGEALPEQETKYLRINSEKAKKELGYSPRFTALEALDLTVDWYRKFYSGTPAIACLDNDLRLFLE